MNSEDYLVVRLRPSLSERHSSCSLQKQQKGHKSLCGHFKLNKLKT